MIIYSALTKVLERIVAGDPTTVLRGRVESSDTPVLRVTVADATVGHLRVEEVKRV